MQILRRLFLLFVLWNVLEFYRRDLFGFSVMDFASCLKTSTENSEFGRVFSLFERFASVCDALIMFLMFLLGLNVLQYSCQCKGLSLMRFLCDFKVRSGCLTEDKGLSFSPFKFPWIVISPRNKSESQKIVLTDGDYKRKVFLEKEADDRQEELYDEDEVDISVLRELVKIERERTKSAILELEKERMAASSAAEEAMSMILRLQNEKSSIEMEAHQFRRMAEQKQLYDQEVIESLRWIIMEHESEMALLGDQLRLAREKVEPCVKFKQGDQLKDLDESMSPFNQNKEVNLSGMLVSSLGIDSPLLSL